MNDPVRKTRLLPAFVVAAVIWSLSCSTSQAAFVSVSSRATLAGTDYIDWSGIGPDGTTVTNPFTINSNGGQTATVSQASSAGVRVTQGLSWSGNYTNGNAVLWTNGNVNNGPLKIMFETAVTAAGTQIQSNYYGAFTGAIDALAADGTTVLATFNYSGNSTNLADNSAIFVGISATGGSQFYGLRFNGLTAAQQPNNFSINRVDFTPSAGGPLTVPVPAGMVLMLTGLPVLGFAGWTRRRAANA